MCVRERERERMIDVRERKEREIKERERKRESVKRTREKNGERHTCCFASFVCGRENETKRGVGS